MSNKELLSTNLLQVVPDDNGGDVPANGTTNGASQFSDEALSAQEQSELRRMEAIIERGRDAKNTTPILKRLLALDVSRALAENRDS